ncbi:hypothetical protein MRX96_006564 [Rhipicephalus microplus]
MQYTGEGKSKGKVRISKIVAGSRADASHGVNPDFFGVASPPHQTLFVNRLRGMCVYDDSPSRLRLKDVTSGTAASKAREKPPPQNQSELPARLRPT